MAAFKPLLFALPLLLSGQTPDASALLAKVDRLRQPWPAFSADLALTDQGRDSLWRLSVAANGDSRLDGLSPKQVVGRAVLMKGEQMWLLTPGSKRAIPVTPQQRLIGSAAGGDLARLRLAEDFQATGVQEAPLHGEPCWRVSLAAKRPSVTY
ncbi:MAG TPA: outer membrane lipoprotein-sorting protein, partial [Holophagaceae bacterium]|nr:outer membrane lipoprotein-sorting protein [Holophagaceae bacterium]